MIKRVDAIALRPNPSALWAAAAVGGGMLALASIDPVLRYSRAITGSDPWAVWPLTPGITLSTLLAAVLYISGERQPAASNGDGFAMLRHLAFFGGLAAVFLALQSPLEPISDHLFLAHQIEHMLLRSTAPILLVLAAPQAALLRGMPGWLRRRVVAPVLGSRYVRALGVLGQPAIATILFVGTTYFWMLPRWHDLALLDERVHYVWHTTLLLSGLIFFWRLLDTRPYPRGASLGVRLFMFWIAAAGNILLGSYLSFKHQVLYSAYAELGRTWAISPATDENYGGLIMWIPGSMMFCMTAILMIYRWARQEERGFLRHDSDAAPPLRAVDFVLERRSANRKVAVGLVCFMITVVAITFTTVLTYHFTAAVGGLAAF